MCGVRTNIYRVVVVSAISFYLAGCSYLASTVSENFGNNLSNVILNHNEPETVAEALPAYLLLLETLIVDDPENESLLLSTATLYGSYISLLPDAASRKKLLSDKAIGFAFRAACVHDQKLCLINEKKYQDFEQIINSIDIDSINVLYTLGANWGIWIQSHKSDWAAIAQLAQVKLLMSRVIELDDSYKQGNAHIYLGVLATILPPALGGAPDVGKQYFETALKLSEQRNLMVKVVYAKHYARMMFDRKLHDRLLNEVLNAKLDQPDLTLMNSLAKKQARVLLESANDYF